MSINESEKDLYSQEKKAGLVVDLGPSRMTLIVGLVLYLIAFFLPFAGSVTGFDILLNNPSDSGFTVSVLERIYVYATFLGLVIFNILVLITRSSILTLLGWFFSGIGLFYSLFAVWMRQTRPAVEQNYGISVGLVLSVLACVILAWGYTGLVLRRTPKQEALFHARVQESRDATPDPIADTQLRLLEEKKKGAVQDPSERRRRG